MTRPPSIDFWITSTTLNALQSGRFYCPPRKVKPRGQSRKKQLPSIHWSQKEDKTRPTKNAQNDDQDGS